MTQFFRREWSVATVVVSLLISATGPLAAHDPAACDPIPVRTPPAPPAIASAPALGSADTATHETMPSSEVTVSDLLEFLRLATGQSVIRVATQRDRRQPFLATPLSTGAPIAWVPTHEPLTVPVVKALLAANGIGVEPFVVEGNVSVLLVREDPKALTKIGERRTGRRSASVESTPRMAHVDASWSIEPNARGWLILDVEHASSSDLRKAIDRLIDARSLRVMEIGSRGQLLLDGPGEALTRAVELVRFLDKAEIWSNPSAPPETGAQGQGATERFDRRGERTRLQKSDSAPQRVRSTRRTRGVAEESSRTDLPVGEPSAPAPVAPTPPFDDSPEPATKQPQSPRPDGRVLTQ